MKLNKLAMIFLVALSFHAGAIFDAEKAYAADAVCQGKPNGESCSIGDSKSVERGKCDGNGNCVLTGTTLTTPSNVGSAGQITSKTVPGSTEAGGIVPCGRPGQEMCTLCDIIRGMNGIIQYLMKIAIGVALLAVTIGGVMYIVSAGDSGLIDSAKSTMKNAAIGFVIIFAGYLIINTTITYLGTKQGMGINVTSWGDFNCDRRESIPN